MLRISDLITSNKNKKDGENIKKKVKKIEDIISLIIEYNILLIKYKKIYA
jgi:hypothetical protein